MIQAKGCGDSVNIDDAVAKGTRIFAIANQKGGVGKTTTAINLATAMAAVGKKVLVIDFDPQANATTGLGLRQDHRNRNSYHLLTGTAGAAEIAQEVSVPGLYLIPGSSDLAGAEVELSGLKNRHTLLKQKLSPQQEGASVVGGAGRWDMVLIDCPPSLGHLTINALVAAEAVLVPLQCEFFALQGLNRLTKTVAEIRNRYNPGLAITGVVLTMFDRRNNLSQLVEQDVRQYLGNTVYDTVIPRNVKVSEAPSHGKPVMLYDHRSAGAVAYAHLAGEMIRREAGASSM